MSAIEARLSKSHDSRHDCHGGWRFWSSPTISLRSSVALPSIEHDLHTDVTTVQWVINGYAMVFGVLIVTGGRLADMFGRRRIFIAGASRFSPASP